ncbi:NUDIX domain-containing protein [Corynebacterium sp.]|uniref:NUDIX hydrolase n=1 Tax=Corynebacterium sp. TaxID=1720 RepID=UPI0026487679|nr:NUDIX domain-containing protein [Corynebacterium sp.]MDN6137889.1 NUDIX domain-containing protein [Corynebacterium sp.]MDN6738220.1 NUDIX domain-containing protein [Corynebacterium sp.]
MVEPLIHVSAVVFRDVNDKVLTVRKRGTEKFMFPGGKPELGESVLDTAIREVKEEIGIGLDAKQLTQIGVFEAPAANEAKHTVVATVFTYDGDTIEPQMAAEIAELSWVSPDQPDVVLAPLLADFVFPAINSRVS